MPGQLKRWGPNLYKHAVAQDGHTDSSTEAEARASVAHHNLRRTVETLTATPKAVPRVLMMNSQRMSRRRMKASRRPRRMETRMAAAARTKMRMVAKRMRVRMSHRIHLSLRLRRRRTRRGKMRRKRRRRSPRAVKLKK